MTIDKISIRDSYKINQTQFVVLHAYVGRGELADQAVQWLGKPVAAPKIPGLNPG